MTENGSLVDRRQATNKSELATPASAVLPPSAGDTAASAGSATGADEKNIVSPSSVRKPSTVLRSA